MPYHFAKATARGLAVPLVLAAALGGCAPAPDAAQAAMAPARAEIAESPTCRPDPALLTPQSPPDCNFARPDLKTLDPAQWARLKVEFERQCYQRAEKSVRERLRLLQLAAHCGDDPARR